MPSIEFSIDKEGKLTSHITGIQGPACDDVAKLLRQLLGDAEEVKTAEYFAQPRAGLRTGANA